MYGLVEVKVAGPSVLPAIAWAASSSQIKDGRHSFGPQTPLF